MRQLYALSIAVVVGLWDGALARAEVVPVFGTGVSPTGALLPDTAIDPHYTLIQYPGQVGTTPAPTFVLSGITHTYILSGTSSKWISWSPTWIDATPSGVWVYRTTFDLTGFLPNTAVLTGRIASDDEATIFLNGVNTGIVSPRSDVFTELTLSTGFVSGVNTIDFRVTNLPFVSFNPSALRVDLSGSATAVPEPSTMALSVVGVVGLLFLRRRTKAFVTARSAV